MNYESSTTEGRFFSMEILNTTHVTYYLQTLIFVTMFPTAKYRVTIK
jgi:RNA 3'-terminal phosphate cyclase